MKRYFCNLLIAILGKDPYQEELNKVKLEYDKTAQAVEHLRKQYYGLLDTKAATEQDVKRLEESVKAFQNLTENLRQRITDKDIALDLQAKEYRDRVARMKQEWAQTEERLKADYSAKYEEKMADRDAKIDALREDLDASLAQLQRANRAMANNLMSQAMLEKTNNGLEDLIAAMQSGDTEKIIMATQHLDWSNHLVRIAQVHLGVLRRKNELVERLHFTENRADDE